MITHTKLSKHPQAAPRLIGMSLAAFDTLYDEFERAHQERLSHEKFTRRTKAGRRRAIGAGRKHCYDLRDRLLMTLFWLCAHTTYEVLGLFYNLNKTNIEDNLKDVLVTLNAIAKFTFRRPSAECPKLNSPEAVMTAFPEVCLMVDAKEQRADARQSTRRRLSVQA